MSRATDLFFGFYRSSVLPCLEQNLLEAPHYFISVSGPYFVAFSAIDHLSAIRDVAIVGRQQANNTKIKTFLEDQEIWAYGKQISLRKLYLDVVKKYNIETNPQQKSVWREIREKLNQEWNLEHHIDDSLVSLQPDCPYDYFLERISALQLPLTNHENYKYSHLLYSLRCDLMHENRPTEQDALFYPEEKNPRYVNGRDADGQRIAELAFPAKMFWSILSNALDYLEDECKQKGIDPYAVKPYKGLTPQERQKVGIVL